MFRDGFVPKTLPPCNNPNVCYFFGMLLIPQIFLKNNRAVRPDNTKTSFFDEDPLVMFKALMDAGVEAFYMMDLSIPHVGESPHLSILQEMHESSHLHLYVGGHFRSVQAIAPFLEVGLDLVVLGSVAYQNQRLVQDACKAFPRRIAVHIDVVSGKVRIPGWTVSANKSALEFAERFRDWGIGAIFYSDVDTSGNLTKATLASTAEFCRKAKMRTFVTSEVVGLQDIESLVRLGVVRFEGLVLERTFYDGRIDISGVTSFVADLMISEKDELTKLEE